MKKAWWVSKSVWLHTVALVAPFGYGRSWAHLDHKVHAMQLHALAALYLRFKTTSPIGIPEKKAL